MIQTLNYSFWQKTLFRGELISRLNSTGFMVKEIKQLIVWTEKWLFYEKHNIKRLIEY